MMASLSASSSPQRRQMSLSFILDCFHIPLKKFTNVKDLGPKLIEQQLISVEEFNKVLKTLKIETDTDTASHLFEVILKNKVSNKRDKDLDDGRKFILALQSGERPHQILAHYIQGIIPEIPAESEEEQRFREKLRENIVGLTKALDSPDLVSAFFSHTGAEEGQRLWKLQELRYVHVFLMLERNPAPIKHTLLEFLKNQPGFASKAQYLEEKSRLTEKVQMEIDDDDVRSFCGDFDSMDLDHGDMAGCPPKKLNFHDGRFRREEAKCSSMDYKSNIVDGERAPLKLHISSSEVETGNNKAPRSPVQPKIGTPKKELVENGTKRNGGQKKKATPMTAKKPEGAVTRPLTEQQIRDTIRSDGYPMRWTELQLRLKPKYSNADALIADFQRKWSNRVSRILICFSRDFVALNMTYHRCRLKLELILRARRRSMIGIGELQELFAGIASAEEISQTRRRSKSLKKFLAKFPQVFTIRGESVTQSPAGMEFRTFFCNEQQEPLASVKTKLKYFQNLCGGHCTDQMACRFLQDHIYPEREQLFVDTEQKCMKLIRSCRNFVIQPQTEEAKQPEEAADFAEPTRKAKVKVHMGTPEVQRILEEKMRPLSWEQLQSYRPAHIAKKNWHQQLDYLKETYLSNRSKVPFLQGEDYIALNTAFARGFLKLCLLVRLIVKRSGRCSLDELNELYPSIVSGSECQQFNESIGLCQELFPTVFQRAEDSCVVAGPEMFAFKEFFECKNHLAAGCRPCCFMEFMNISGGKVNFSKALHLMKMVASLNPEVSGGVLPLAEFDQLLAACKSVYLRDSVINTRIVYKPAGANRQGEKTIHKFTSRAVPRAKASPNVVTVPEQSLSASPSMTPARAHGDTLEAPPATIDRDQAAAPAPHQGPCEENRTNVTVHFINNSETLDTLLTKMQTHERPIISIACTEDAIVVIDRFLTGFVLPIPSGGSQTADKNTRAQWSSLWNLFQNAVLVLVIFDCEDVGRFLLEKLDLQLITVFDVKAAVELLNGDSPAERQLPCSSIAELCQSLGSPCPDQVDHQIIGEKNGLAADARLSEVIQKAASLIPGVYSEIYSKLHKLNLLEQLHKITNSKLQALYRIKVDSRLPGEIKEDLSGQTIGGAPVSVTHTSTTQPPSGIQSDRNHNNTSPLSGESLTIGNVSMDSLYWDDSPSGPLLSQPSNSSAPSTQNGINQFPVPVGGLGSIVPARDWSTASAGSSHSSRSRQQSASSNRPSSGPSVGSGRQDPKFSHPSWRLPSPSQNGTPQDSPAQSDGFGNDMDAGLDGLEHLGEVTASSTESTSQLETLSGSNVSGLTEELIEHYTRKNRESVLLLLDVLGEDIQTTFSSYAQQHTNRQVPTEIVLDVGQHAKARFHKNNRSEKSSVVRVSSQPITSQDLESIVANDALTGFDDQSRCGIEGTLHTVRGLRNRKKKMVGLTIHVGLPLLGCADMVYDIAKSGRSTLILGYPGVGKTTLLRELARCLSDNEKKRVLVIDTYNEIAGDCDVAHFSIGSARRFQVPEQQHVILLESAKDHDPEVIIVDQIDSGEDVRAVSRLSKIGIQVIAGTNRDSVQSLITDDSLSQIFHTSDPGLDDNGSIDSAGALASAKLHPPFEALVEMVESGCWFVHDLKHTFSSLRAGQQYTVQERSRIDGSDRDGGIGKKITLREKVIDPTQH